MLSQRSDIELINDLKGGSRAAFHELYARYSDVIYRNILARVNSSFDADDIFQVFFVQLWEKRETIAITSSVKGYLLIWLKNHVLNTIKQEQMRERYSGEVEDAADDYSWVKIVAEDLDVQIRRIVEKFPPRLRCVYLMTREEHLSVKEIAERLSVSEQTVKNQLTDVLKRLRKEMSRKNFLYSL